MKKVIKLNRPKIVYPEKKSNKYETLVNPRTKTKSFGFVEITDSSPSLINGEIFLPIGEAYSYSGGFGAEHIWRKHKNDMQAAGYTEKSDVAAFVAKIIRAGSNVQSEFNHQGKPQDLKVIRGTIGLAVLKYRGRPNYGYYQIITAFRQNTPDGVIVGTIREVL